GVGWGAAWGPDAPAGSFIRNEIGFWINHAHQGYLDVWLQIGLVGFSIFLTLLLALTVRSIRLAMTRPETFYTWAATVVIFLLAYSFAEVRITKLLGWWLVCTVLHALTTDRSADGAINYRPGARHAHRVRPDATRIWRGPDTGH